MMTDEEQRIGQAEHRTEDGLEVLLSENAPLILKMVLGIASAVLLLVTFAYFIYFLAPPLNISTATLGQAGDYFGGILNPILSFLSVFALLVALVVQGRELRLSREALKVSQEELMLTRKEQAKASKALDAQNKSIQKQSFEQTFFAWLGTYRELLQEVSAGTGQMGRHALKKFWDGGLDSRLLWHIFETTRENGFLFAPLDLDYVKLKYSKGVATQFQEMAEESKPDMAKLALHEWARIYNNNAYQLDNLFRVLYRLIQWIHAQDVQHLNQAQKWFYVGLVRAQLSQIELVYLFYNGHTDRGASFKALANEYALFDNLDFESDPALELLKGFPPDGIGYADTAYCSGEAREASGLPVDTREALSATTAVKDGE